MNQNTVSCSFPIKPRRGSTTSPEKRVKPKPARPTSPCRAARLLALAYYIEAQIEAGELADYAAAARSLGLTRARLTQVMNLLLLAPELQRRLLVGEFDVSERGLRAVSAEANWQEQLDLWPPASKDMGA